MQGDLLDTAKDTSKKLAFQFEDFSGGMCRNTDPSGIANNEYALLVNGRNRYGSIAPVKGPLNLTSELPAGNKQGLYGFDSIMVVFQDGQAFARDFSQLGSAFQLIPAFHLKETVDTVYAEAVPASWLNVQRKLNEAADIKSDVALFSEVFGTPAAIVCQDGESRPQLIFSTGQARAAKDVGDWSSEELTGQDRREYVPVGKQMLYSSEGILYIVSPDGKEIYRSVTGRPLDFVVAIDENGNKLPNLTSGKPEAARLSYKLDYDTITCIKQIGAKPRITDEGEGFFVSTRKRSWIVYPNFGTTLFGEPTYSNQNLFPTGALNQFSFTDILGDSALITESGITSFNSILSVSNEGKNAPFHDKIYKIFENGTEQILQQVTAAITSDNYAFLAVDTVYGAAILIYDTLRQQFAALDIYDEVEGYIKQFAEVKYGGERYLYFITTEGQLFEAFAGETLTAKVYLKEVMSDNTIETELIPRRVRVALDSIAEDGEVAVTVFTDSKAGEKETQTFEAPTTSVALPLTLPFGSTTDDDVTVKTFKIEAPQKGTKIGLFVELTGQAEIHKIELITEREEKQVSEQEAAAIFNERKTL